MYINLFLYIYSKLRSHCITGVPNHRAGALVDVMYPQKEETVLLIEWGEIIKGENPVPKCVWNPCPPIRSLMEAGDKRREREREVDFGPERDQLSRPQDSKLMAGAFSNRERKWEKNRRRRTSQRAIFGHSLCSRRGCCCCRRYCSLAQTQKAKDWSHLRRVSSLPPRSHLIETSIPSPFTTHTQQPISEKSAESFCYEHGGLHNSKSGSDSSSNNNLNVGNNILQAADSLSAKKNSLSLLSSLSLSLFLSSLSLSSLSRSVDRNCSRKNSLLRYYTNGMGRTYTKGEVRWKKKMPRIGGITWGLT